MKDYQWAELEELCCRSTTLSQNDIEALETAIVENPDDYFSRLKLLKYACLHQDFKPKADTAIWFIANMPELPDVVYSAAFGAFRRRNSLDDYFKLESAWIDRADVEDASEKLLINAAKFIRLYPKKIVQLLSRAVEKDKNQCEARIDLFQYASKRLPLVASSEKIVSAKSLLGHYDEIHSFYLRKSVQIPDYLLRDAVLCAMAADEPGRASRLAKELFDGAYPAYCDAIEIKARAISFLGIIALQENNVTEAQRKLTELEKLTPNHHRRLEGIWLYSDLLNALILHGEVEFAKKFAHRNPDLEMGRIPSRNLLDVIEQGEQVCMTGGDFLLFTECLDGIGLADHGRVERAKEYLQILNKLEVRSPHVWWKIAVLSIKCKDRKRALQALERACSSALNISTEILSDTELSDLIRDKEIQLILNSRIKSR